MNIEYVKNGIGNRFEDHIELNENLKRYPKLHHAILQHELSHTDKIFSKPDLMLDLGDSKVSTIELIKFMIENPKSLSQFLPFYWTKKYGFVYDINLILIYAILISIIGIGLYIGFKI